ncbi:MAG TPA: ATP-dependent RNA helicase [Clostridiales bacterium]|nr:MAG: ATP-dependent RNA helicase [Clostridiales bacterium GWD2_32_59]HAN10671.1 ATP-dependent RNA helicase [Clostridiales bacterium]
MEEKRIEELGCSQEIMKAIKEMGFEAMTPIQSLSIPLGLEGRDVVGQAQTGTGKTAAFGIPIIEKIDVKLEKTQALVLCPTRELAVQVAEEIIKIAKYKVGINVLPIFGGQPIDRQIKGLKKGVQIVIGTPGRIMDHLRRKTLKFDNLSMFVLDEADEMLKMGFREDIEEILKGAKPERQTMLFSATMPRQIMDIIHKYQKNPQIVRIEHKELTAPNTEQRYVEVKERDKVEVLTRLIDMYNPKLSMVFCNTKRKVDDVTEQIQSRGYMADKIHGDMKQELRSNILKKFKRGTIEILVATDVAARGLDIDEVEAVFNFDMPTHEEFYVHRIGRTGRAGREGKSFSLVTSSEFNSLRSIMKYTNKKMESHKIPTAGDVENLKTEAFLIELKEKIDNENLEKYIKIVEGLIEDNYAAAEIAAALLSMKLELPITNKDIETLSTFNEMAGARDSRDSRDMDRLFINIGRNKGITPKDVVGAIADKARIQGKFIGDIDIHENYTFIEIPGKYAEQVIAVMQGNTIKGATISIEKSSGKGQSKKRGSRTYDSRSKSGSESRGPRRDDRRWTNKK